MSKLPLQEIERQYRIYLNEVTEQRVAFMMMQEAVSQQEAMAVATSNGGGSLIITEVVDDYIEFVADAGYNTDFAMEVEVSSDTTYTVNWGDGTIEDGELLTGTTTISHDFPGDSEPTTVRMTFADPNAVIRLEFYNND